MLWLLLLYNIYATLRFLISFLEASLEYTPLNFHETTHMRGESFHWTIR